MILLVGTVRVPPHKVAEAKAAMEAMILGSRAEAGCIEYAYSQDVLDPGLMRVTEIWRDREALKAHFQTPHMAAWRAQWASFEIHDRNLSLYEAGEPEPI